tara:strand:- start:45 stop:1940 length:1896 start_codon:yes stop_codon:yes gene_type:complete
MATLQEVVDQLKQNNVLTTSVLKNVSSLNSSLSVFFTGQKRESLKALEKSREAYKAKPQATSGGSATAGGAGGGFLGGFKGGLLGSLLAGGGVGLAAAGVGIAAFFGALSGVDSIMNKFGDGSNLKKLMTNLAGGLAAFSDRDLKALGAVLGAGALFGAVPLLSGLGGGVGVGAMGVGIAAFFTALAGGDMAIGMMESTGKNLSQFLQNFAQGIGSLDDKSLLAVGGLLATSGAFGALFGVGKAAKAGVSIALIGAGIAAFFAAFALGDMAIAEMQSNGESIKKIVMVFGEMMDGLSGKALTALTAIAGVSGLAALFPGGELVAAKAAGGMAAIGAGIGLFFAGIGAGDVAISKINELFGTKPGEGFGNLLKNTAEGLKSFTDLKFDPSLGPALEGISSALLAFFGSDLMKTLGEITQPIKEGFLNVVDFLFGTDFAEGAKKTPIEKLVEGLDPLKSIDPAIMRTLNILPPALDTMTSAFTRLSRIDTTQFGKGMLSAVQGLIFASDAMLGLQTGKISTGKSTMDPNDYFGGYKIGNNINFPEGGIVNSTSEVDAEAVRKAINRVYTALGIDVLENVRRDVSMSSTGGGSGGGSSYSSTVGTQVGSINNQALFRGSSGLVSIDAWAKHAQE